MALDVHHHPDEALDVSTDPSPRHRSRDSACKPGKGRRPGSAHSRQEYSVKSSLTAYHLKIRQTEKFSVFPAAHSGKVGSEACVMLPLGDYVAQIALARDAAPC